MNQLLNSLKNIKWWDIISKEKDSNYNPILQAKILEIVENQIRDNNPKETKETLNR